MADPVLIIGGGLAGLFCALKLAPHPVMVFTAAPVGRGASSAWAQAGIAAAVSEGDTIEKHVHDTMVAGDGIVDERIARIMAAGAVDRVTDLLAFGVPFDRDLAGKLETSREAAHSESRIVRVRGDMAGRAIMEALVGAAREAGHIRFMEGHVVETLHVEDGRAVGLTSKSRAGRGRQLRTDGSAIVMAAGGIGHLYAITTNPTEARGGGIGMAARAGVTMADMEFTQFHPTGIDVGLDPTPLATEALRGHGATLINRDGERFMVPIHPDAELAPRDVVARGIFREVLAGRGAFLDCREAVPRFAEEFPTVHGYCVAAGIDPAREAIPVVPAAHYFMGGIAADEDGLTSLEGLFACGEVSSTGAHGANRLASNSLLEAVVFSSRVATHLHGALPPATAPAGFSDGGVSDPVAETHHDTTAMTELRRTMSRCMGVLRDEAGMTECLRLIARLERGDITERFRNVLATAKLMTVSALRREESRGGHFRTDYPNESEALRRRSEITVEEADRATEHALAGVPA